MDETKTSMYLVAIVGVVAAVGILVLLMGAGFSGDVTGQAYIKLNAKDDAAGLAAKSTGGIADASTVDSYLPDCSGTCRDSSGKPVCCA